MVSIIVASGLRSAWNLGVLKRMYWGWKCLIHGFAARLSFQRQDWLAWRVSIISPRVLSSATGPWVFGAAACDSHWESSARSGEGENAANK